MNTAIKKKIIHFIGIFLVFVLTIGLIPVRAAKTKSVTVKTKKQILAAMAKSDVDTITYKTAKSGEITISPKKGSEYKKLVIDAPKIRVTNNASFKTVTIKNVRSYTEKASGNTIYASAKKTSLTVVANAETSIVCNKKNASVTLNVGKKSVVDITLTKKTKLIVKGKKSAIVNIISIAKGSKVTVSVPAYIDATKNMSVILNAGSEGTTINRTTDKITVKVTNKSNKQPIMKIGSDKTVSPTPSSSNNKPKATVTPKPSATPSPTPIVTYSNTGNVVYAYPAGDGGSSYSGGGSSYSGGGSSSGGSSISGGGNSGSGNTTGIPQATTIPSSAPVTTATPTPTPIPLPSFTVSTKAELVSLLSNLSGINTRYAIIFKTNDTVSVELAANSYPNITLIIDAPNATFTNYATFENIELKNISEHTWYEHANGNTITSYTLNTHIIVGLGAINTVIKIENGVSEATIENSGTGHSISSLYVNVCSKVSLKGSNHTNYTVYNLAKNSTITTSVEVTLQTKFNVNFQIMVGGETSNAILIGEDIQLNVTGLGNIPVYDFLTDKTYDVTAEQLQDPDLESTLDRGNILGNVILANGSTASNARIKVYWYKSNLQTAVEQSPVITTYTNTNGFYQINGLKYGNYYLEYTLNGYKAVYRILCVSAGEISLDDTMMVSTSSGISTVEGALVDATTGNSINTNQITVILRNGLGNISGDIFKTAKTDNNGYYKIFNMPAGAYTLQVSDNRGSSAGSYAKTFININVLGSGESEIFDVLVNYQGNDDTQTDDDSNAQLRFVLRWNDIAANGSVPPDLDAHLLGSTGTLSDNVHIYCQNRDYNDGNTEVNLDIDDYTYMGPETITVNKTSDGIYRFYVYDYSDRSDQRNGRLSSSGAEVKVYKGNREIGVFYVPARKTGTLWYVCSYDTNTNVLTPVNEVYYHPGNSENVGTDPKVLMRDQAFTLQNVREDNSYMINVETDLTDNTMHIRGPVNTLTENSVFYYKYSGAETEYTPVENRDYDGIAKVTFNGETINFRVYYTQAFLVKFEGDSIIRTNYYHLATFSESEGYYTTYVYGEEVPNELKIQFSSFNVETQYESTYTQPFSDGQEIGIFHFQYKGKAIDIHVRFYTKTDAFDYLKIEADGLTRQYFQYISSNTAYAYSETLPENLNPTITFKNPNVVYSYESVTGQGNYIGKIHARYKDFTATIKVYYAFDTSVFDKVTIRTGRTQQEYTVYEKTDDPEEGNPYYYIDFYRTTEPSYLEATFRNANVTVTYDNHPNKNYLGIIHAQYGNYSRDIRVIYHQKTFSRATGLYISYGNSLERYYSISEEQNTETSQTSYYVRIFDDAKPVSLTTDFDDEGIFSTYEPITGEEYIGIIHVDQCGIEYDIKVYYTFTLDNLHIYTNGATNDSFYIYNDDFNEDSMYHNYYYVELASVNPISDPVLVKADNPAIQCSYTPVSGENYIGLIHATYEGQSLDIRVYYVQVDDPDNVYTYDFASDQITKQTIYDSYYNEIYVTEYENGLIQRYTIIDEEGYTIVKTYEYNSAGNILEITCTDYFGDITVYSYEYDADGNQIKETMLDSAGNTDVYQYDSNHVMISSSTTTSDTHNVSLCIIHDRNYFDFETINTYAVTSAAITVDTSAVTSSAIRFDFMYHGSENALLKNLIKEGYIYNIPDAESEPVLLLSANYSYDDFGFATETKWTYEEDGSYRIWRFDKEGRGIVTTYNPDGSVKIPEAPYNCSDDEEDIDDE
ncbi:MAG: hypothetical protein IKW90_03000 [Lachnospiraceae bacterium]|nr:hypothetical protein [Lachnospiraceae bacterium]